LDYDPTQAFTQRFTQSLARPMVRGRSGFWSWILLVTSTVSSIQLLERNGIKRRVFHTSCRSVSIGVTPFRLPSRGWICYCIHVRPRSGSNPTVLLVLYQDGAFRSGVRPATVTLSRICSKRQWRLPSFVLTGLWYNGVIPVSIVWKDVLTISDCPLPPCTSLCQWLRIRVPYVGTHC